jgi:endo-1,4-beta-xylanase
MVKTIWVTMLFVLPLLSSYGQQAISIGSSEQEKKKGLKDYYSDYFPMGVAVSPRALQTDEAVLIKQEFNSITAENAMKMVPIHPKENEYF